MSDGQLRVGTGKAERGILLVGIEEALQLDSVVADVGDVEQGVLVQGALDAEEVALDVAISGVFGDVGDVVGRRVEAGDQAAGKPWSAVAKHEGVVVPIAMIWAGSGVEQWLVMVGVIWVTEANCACGALMPRMSPEPARV